MFEIITQETISRIKREPEKYFGASPILKSELTMVLNRRFSVLSWIRLSFQDFQKTVVIKIPRLSIDKSERKLEKVRANIKKEFEVAKELGEKLSSFPFAKVVKPIALFLDLPSFVMEENSGEPLLKIIEDEAKWYPFHGTMDDLRMRCFQTGKWLRIFQSLSPPSEERFSLDLMRNYLDIRLNLLFQMGASGMNQSWRNGFSKVFDKLAVGVREKEKGITLVHGDFSLSNILSNGKEIILLDFSGFGNGSPFYDLTRCYHQLGLLLNKPYFRPITVDRLRKALLEGYDEKLDSTSPLFILFLIQHHICHWLGRIKEERNNLHEKLINQWICYRERNELSRLMKEYS